MWGWNSNKIPKESDFYIWIVCTRKKYTTCFGQTRFVFDWNYMYSMTKALTDCTFCVHLRYGNWKKLYTERWNVVRKPLNPKSSCLRLQHFKKLTWTRWFSTDMCTQFLLWENKSLIFSGRNYIFFLTPFYLWLFSLIILLTFPA